ncbi:MAG: cell division protein ZapA, partial [Bryobacteraceae bacterium]
PQVGAHPHREAARANRSTLQLGRSMAGEKKSVRLSIYNQSFTLLVSGDPSEMEAAAHEVDALMNTIARSGNMDATRVATLACLHLQDQLRGLEAELDGLRSSVESRTRNLSILLDEVIE